MSLKNSDMRNPEMRKRAERQLKLANAFCSGSRGVGGTMQRKITAWRMKRLDAHSQLVVDSEVRRRCRNQR